MRNDNFITRPVSNIQSFNNLQVFVDQLTEKQCLTESAQINFNVLQFLSKGSFIILQQFPHKTKTTL